MPRLFTGISLPQSAAFQLSLLKGRLSNARWMEQDDYHISLRFLGDVTHETANEIDSVLSLLQVDPFELQIKGLDAFGGDKPRLLYANVMPSDNLSRLQTSHEMLCQKIGLKAESRNFTPHVTLARLRQGSAEEVAGFISQFNGFAPIIVPVNSFNLYSAKDSVGGGPYVVEKKYPISNHGQD